ncbi:uncharacterized protein [Nicotiana sylvestris]|uniref:uncharacterized protein n=1 Tax=Nicotiana sylvestris TaxID=4096 RepID=UPI00388CCF92
MACNQEINVIYVSGKARNLLYNTISGEEYEKISSCDTAKDMCDKVEVTYEGTSKSKETRINLLINDYELFEMKEGESIKKIFAPFSKIIGDLKLFGRSCSRDKQFRKILRIIPTAWETKVITLQAQDLDKSGTTGRSCYIRVNPSQEIRIGGNKKDSSI